MSDNVILINTHCLSTSLANCQWLLVVNHAVERKRVSLEAKLGILNHISHILVGSVLFIPDKYESLCSVSILTKNLD